MRLINVDTMRLQECTDSMKHFDYVILSHTWGDEEVSFQEFVSGTGREKAGYHKISRCCELARNEGYQYIWIDTCCIDKSSSSELFEAINSMFRWYEEASICYAYLADVDQTGASRDVTISAAMKSRWFTRGWTLQELIAPGEVVFLNRAWEEIGTRSTLTDHIRDRTSIDTSILRRATGPTSRPIQFQLEFFSVAERMSWAADRQTSRREDEAYSLMGLFCVHMPLIYGEGTAAFQRLQQEIMSHSDDPSLFAWESDGLGGLHFTGLLATSPADFRSCHGIRTNFTSTPMRSGQMALFQRGLTPNVCEISHKKLRLCLPVLGPLGDLLPNKSTIFDQLRCTHPGQPLSDDIPPRFSDCDLPQIRDAIIVILPCLKKQYFIGLLLSKWPGVNFSDVVFCRLHKPSLILIEQDGFKFPAACNVYCYNPITYRLQPPQDGQATRYKADFTQLKRFGYYLDTKIKQTAAGIESQQQSSQTKESPESPSATYGNGIDELTLFFQHPNPMAWPPFYVIARNASPLMIGVAIWASREDIKMPDSNFQEDFMYHYVFSGHVFQFPLAPGKDVVIKWRTHNVQLNRLILCISQRCS